MAQRTTAIILLDRANVLIDKTIKTCGLPYGYNEKLSRLMEEIQDVVNTLNVEYKK